MDATLQLIINIGAVATALAAVIGLPLTVVKLWPLLKTLVEDIRNLKSIPDITAALTQVKGEVAQVKAQVKNSHNENLRDNLDRYHRENLQNFKDVQDQITSLRRSDNDQWEAIRRGRTPRRRGQ